MKPSFACFTVVAALLIGGHEALAVAHRLAVTIEPRFGDQPLAFDTVTHRIAAGQVISVTRLDFLLSNIALRRSDGEWRGLTNRFAYVSAREGRTSFTLDDLPAGRYDRMRFSVGLPPEVNHRDPAGYPAGHPLHPDVNGLHWGWMGGYVFLALEGHWRDAAPVSASGRGTGDVATAGSGFSFHLATDRQLMTVELPLALDLVADLELQLALHVDRILAHPNLITLDEATASTHSRTNDALAALLRDNVARAFAVSSLSSAEGERIGRSGPRAPENPPLTKAPLIAPNATPYALTISRFFPRPALPLDNPLTEEGVALGRRLFVDPRLSVNNSQSCASCHQPGMAFTDGRASSIGAEGQVGTRSAMPLFNLAWKSSFFWDGRAATLREQVLLPIQNPIEMHETLSNLVAKLNRRGSRGDEAGPGKSEIRPPESETGMGFLNSPATNETDYPVLFAAAFGSREITPDRIARALEQFLLTQVSCDSKFDRVLAGQATFTAAEQRGFELFHTEYDPRRRQFGADCFHCHGGPLFQSQGFANNGLDAGFIDPGRAGVTGRDGDRGRFAVPSLRNISLTAPYMHDGRFATLEEVVEHYSTGVKRSATLDPNLANHPAGGVPLSPADKQALAAFLRTLTGESLRHYSQQEIVSSANRSAR